jgi:DNA-binding winged helix-turn-helix (wHTH) protein
MSCIRQISKKKNIDTVTRKGYIISRAENFVKADKKNDRIS